MAAPKFIIRNLTRYNTKHNDADEMIKQIIQKAQKKPKAKVVGKITIKE